MEQEEHVHERDDDRLFDQGALERLDGALDERRAVVERHDPHARRQPRLERPDLLLHTVDDADRADAVARDDHAADGFLGALDERGHAEGVAELHVGDLSHEDRHAVLGADDHLLEIADARDQAEPADDRPRPARLDDVAADVAVASHDGVDHGGERDPVRAQAVGIDVDLVLAHGSADAGHLGHAGHRVELVADEPVLQRPEVAEGRALALNGVPEDMAHACGIRAERGDHAARQRLREQVQPLEHARACEVEIDVVLEDDIDHREAEGRRGAHHTDAGQPLEAHRQRVGDLVLHLLRRPPRPVGEDDDLVVGQIGNRVDRRRHERPVAPGADEHEERDHEEAVPQRQLDEPVDHARSSGVADAHADRRARRSTPYRDSETNVRTLRGEERGLRRRCQGRGADARRLLR